MSAISGSHMMRAKSEWRAALSYIPGLPRHRTAAPRPGDSAVGVFRGVGRVGVDVGRGLGLGFASPRLADPP